MIQFEKTGLKELASIYVDALADLMDVYNSKGGRSLTREKERTFLKNFKKIKRKTILKKKVIPLAAALLLIGVLAGCWKPISGFLIDIYEKFADVFFMANIGEINVKEVKVSYVPDGFVLVDEIVLEETKMFLYSGEDEKILTVSVETGNQSKGVDIENAEYKQNPENFIVQKGDCVILIAYKQNITIEVVGQITKEQAVKILDGLIIQKKGRE